MSQWEICILNRYVKAFRGGDNPLPVLDAHLKKKNTDTQTHKNARLRHKKNYNCLIESVWQ